VICYFDTSAFVPLLIAESSTELCGRLWSDADSVVTSQLSYVEAAAALAQARRLDRISATEHRAGLRRLDLLWTDFDVLGIDDNLVRHAASLAFQCSFRGYDALHCASAAAVDADDLVMASGDRKLLDACISLGIATADTNP
jgi:predicted nucleic acid-binding protein